MTLSTWLKGFLFIYSLIVVNPAVKAQAFSWLSQPDVQAGLVLNGSTGSSKISANGRYIAFLSNASNIVAGDTNQGSDLFIQDTLTQTIQRFALSDGLPDLRSFSTPTSDGRYIILSTNRDGSAENRNFVYLLDTLQETFTLQNINLNGDRFDLSSTSFFLADDGSQMIFNTGENLNPMHTDSSGQIYAKDLNTNQYTLLSQTAGGVIAEGSATLLDVSVNQQFIALNSRAENLLPGTSLNSRGNLMVLDLSDNSYQLASVQPDGSASDDSFLRLRSVSISNSGQVVYITDMDDLVIGDNNDSNDVFFFDGSSNTRINLDSNGQELASGASSFRDSVVISPNDAFISYSSSSELIVPNGDNNQTFDTFIFDIGTGITTRASSLGNGQAASDSTYPTAISTNGEKLIMRSYAKDYGLGTVINGQQQTFVYNTTQQQLTQMYPLPGTAVNTSHRSISQSHITSDQKFAFYLSQSPYLSQDTVSDYTQFETRIADLFEHDRSDDSHSIIARKIDSDVFNGGGIDVSSSGRYVTFVSNYFQPAANFRLSEEEVFLYDRSDNSYIQIGPGRDSRVNDAGMVVFTSFSDLLPQDTNGQADVYLFDSADNSISLVSKNQSGTTSVWNSEDSFISDSATEVWVGFTSRGDDFINNDTNNEVDVFIYNWPSGNTIRVSQLPDGTGGDESSTSSYQAGISAEGDYVVFSSRAQNLTNDDYSNSAFFQLFLYERATQEITLVSKASGGLPFTDDEHSLRRFDISDSGRYVSFAAEGEFSSYNDFDSASDVFLYDHQTQQIELISNNSASFVQSNGSFNPQVVEDLSVSPPLIGVIFDGASDFTGINSHSGHSESYLYQQGGPNVELTIDVVGIGTVSGSFGVNCMTNCDSNYPLGTTLNLLAVPDAGFVFDRWSSTRSDCTTTQNCTLTMDREKTIQAIFIDPADIIFSDGFE